MSAERPEVGDVGDLKMIKRLLCWLGFHCFEPSDIDVFKPFCKYCGKVK